MTYKELNNLQSGDIIRHKSFDSNRNFVVTANFNTHVTAVASVDMTNPIEWELVSKHSKSFHLDCGEVTATISDIKPKE